MAKEIKFTKEDIGAELLPMLTTGLYRDALDTLREYIQNSIDADAKNIKLSIDSDQIVIADDGIGMNEQDAKKAIRLGISDKNPLKNVGFRGIGIYSAFNLCEKVTIYTKRSRSSTYQICFDFEKVRMEILKEQERKKKGLDSKLYLESLLNQAVKIIKCEKVIPILKGHGTVVIASGLATAVYERLNNWKEVSLYLENTVPLPFRREFKFAKTVEKRFKELDYKIVPLTLKIGGREEKLYRPYTNELFHNKGQHDVKFFELKEGKIKYGFAWICINDARKALKDKCIRGLLIKKFEFSISDRRFLESYFPRNVFYRRMTGEIILQNNNLIPNAARNDLEYNSVRQDFFKYLPKFIDSVTSWANDLQQEDKARQVVAEVTERLKKINDSLVVLRRDKEALLHVNNELNGMERELRSHRKTLGEIASKELKSADKLLRFCSEFVTAELTQGNKKRKRLEKKVEDIVRSGSVKLTEDEKRRLKQKPKSLNDLLDTFGITDDEIKRFIAFLDENILQEYLNKEDYTMTLEQLSLYMEENF